jgi:hypothetical protein
MSLEELIAEMKKTSNGLDFIQFRFGVEVAAMLGNVGPAVWASVLEVQGARAVCAADEYRMYAERADRSENYNADMAQARKYEDTANRYRALAERVRDAGHVEQVFSPD